MSQHFNQLTPAEAERLAILSEECGEVVQAIGKILRHGLQSRHPNGGATNRELLAFEIGDLFHAVEMLVVAGDLDGDAILAAKEEKALRIAKHLHHQPVEESREGDAPGAQDFPGPLV